MPQLYNLVVELNRSFPAQPVFGIELSPPAAADERTLAWIDECFGGAWSGEAYAGSNVIARCAQAPVGFATFGAQGLKYAWLDGVARETQVGIFGPFGIAPGQRKIGLDRVLLARALEALRERGYRRALIPAVGNERLVRYYADTIGATVAESFERESLLRPARRTLVMASGNGSNLQAVLDASRSGTLPIDVVALLSNDENAYAIERARRAGVESIAVLTWNRAKETRDAYDGRLLDAALALAPDLVLLLGWMHLLSDSFLREFPELLNLHPAFLPLDPSRNDVVMPDGSRIPVYRGPRAVRDALGAASPWVGATLHRVTTATDRGPVMARKPLPVDPGENEEPLLERVHALEREVVHAGLTRWLFERTGR